MKKDFQTELTELINKHNLEGEMRDTPDYILAKVCIDAMAIFSEAIARRDEWHGFRKADEQTLEKQDNKNPVDCEKCKYRLKCANFLSKCSIKDMIAFFVNSNDVEEKSMINSVIKDVFISLNGYEKNTIKCTCIYELKKMTMEELHNTLCKSKKYESLAICLAIRDFLEKV